MFSYRSIARPFVWGHRGVPHVKLENTIESFEEVATYKLDGFEFDVQFSRDGMPFVFHDETLFRLAGLDQRAIDLPWARLRAIALRDLDHPELGKATVPSLEEVLRIVPVDMFINLELKGHYALDINQIARILELLDQYSLRERTLISSFRHSLLQMVVSLDPHVSLATLWDGEITADQLRTQRDLSNIVHMPWSSVTANTIRMLHDVDCEVGVWGARGLTEVAQCLSSGVDAIFVDDPRWIAR